MVGKSFFERGLVIYVVHMYFPTNATSYLDVRMSFASMKGA